MSMVRLVTVLIGLVIAIDASPRDFRFAVITPPAHIWTQAAEELGEALDIRTNGRLKVSVFPSQQLGNEAQVLRQLQTGAVDMAFLTVAEISNRVSDFGAFYAPYLVNDIGEAAWLLRSNEATTLLKQLPRKIGVVGIGYGTAGMRHVLTRREANSFADLHGRKLRVTPFAPILDFYQIVGAAPIPVPLASVYDALANGQVDAIDMDLETIVKLRYYELADSLLLTNHMMFPMVGLVSARVWVRLDEQDQRLIHDLMASTLDSLIDDYVDAEAGFLGQLNEIGIRIVGVDKATISDVIEQWDTKWRRETPVVDILRSLDKTIPVPFDSTINHHP